MKKNSILLILLAALFFTANASEIGQFDFPAPTPCSPTGCPQPQQPGLTA